MGIKATRNWGQSCASLYSTALHSPVEHSTPLSEHLLKIFLGRVVQEGACKRSDRIMICAHAYALLKMADLPLQLDVPQRQTAARHSTSEVVILQ